MYEVRPRKDYPGVDLISDALHSVGCGSASQTQSARNDYALHRSRSCDAVIRVYDEACKLIELHRHKGKFKNYDPP